jgi:GINS complex subunit 3
VPAALSQRVINALKADPKTVELRSQAQHFYNLGARIMELFEGEEMIDILTDVRDRMLLDGTGVDLFH